MLCDIYVTKTSYFVVEYATLPSTVLPEAERKKAGSLALLKRKIYFSTNNPIHKAIVFDIKKHGYYMLTDVYSKSSG